MLPDSMKFRHTEDISPMRDIIVFLSRINRVKFILALFAGNYIIGWIIWQLLYFFEPEFLESLSTYSEIYYSISLIFRIAIEVIIVPFLETIVFQFFLLIIVKKCSDWITKSNNWTYPFYITSLLFAALHASNFGLNYYGLLNAVILIIPAFSLTILAIVEFEREKGHPILSVWTLHALNNLLLNLEELISFLTRII